MSNVNQRAIKLQPTKMIILWASVDTTQTQYMALETSRYGG